ncbi:MAG: CGNR zinc finger domain-containing protein [Thermomicrobiales bacterium]
MPRSSVATNGPIASTAIRPLRGGACFLDFINTVDRTPEAPGALPAWDDLAPGYANLLAWAEMAGLVEEAQAESLRRTARKDGRGAAAVRRRAVALREALHGLVTAMLDGEEPSSDALETLDAEVRLLQQAQELAVVDGRLVSRTAPGRDRDLDAVLRPVVASAREVLGDHGVTRIRRCAAPECRTLFLDTTKNGSRRFCSASGCGNVTRIRRFRARQAAASESPPIAATTTTTTT